MAIERNEKASQHLCTLPRGLYRRIRRLYEDRRVEQPWQLGHAYPERHVVYLLQVAGSSVGC